MPLNSNPQPIQVHVDPLSYIAELQILSGNNAQTYNNDSKSFEPDRSLVPSLIMPAVSATDPNGEIVGAQDITSAKYYIGAPKADGSNLIVSGGDYIISDTGCPTHSLKVKANIPVNAPIEVFSVFTFVDKRIDKEVTIERSLPYYTALYESKNYSVKLNQPAQFTVDPLRVAGNTIEDKWLIPISAQLYSGYEAVPDANAAYFWQYLKSNVWTNMNPEEDFFIQTDLVNGRWPKNIVIDARMDNNLAIRCLACYYTGTYPTAPTNAELEARTTMNVCYPKSLTVQSIQTKGIKISPTMNTEATFEAIIFDNNKIFTGKDFLFQFEWLLKPTSTSNEVVIGTERTVSFIPAKLGVKIDYTASIRCRVKTVQQVCPVKDGDNYVTYNNQFVTIPLYV